MQKITNIDDANKLLAAYVPVTKEIIGKDITVGRIAGLLDFLGNPQRLRVIHIAGTSGKTSTAYYISALLRQAGRRVGLTVSPHIDSVTERVQINGAPLPEKDFCRELGIFLELIKDYKTKPSYFEVLIAFAYWVFDRREVDYAVIETGMGGLHDGTNVAKRSDKVCVITDIGLDHVHILGTTLTEIAKQKAGIIQNLNNVFMYRQNDEVMRSVRQTIYTKKAKLNIVTEDNDREYTVGMPLFQQRNWQLAYRAVRYVLERDGYKPLTENKLYATQQITVPGRMDTTRLADGRRLIMDGAHNQQKVRTFVESLATAYPGQKAAVMLAVKQDKEYEAVIEELLPVTSKFIFTKFKGAQDLPATALNPETLSQAAKSLGFSAIVSEADIEKAYSKLLEQNEKLLVVTGSFYLVAQLRLLIGKHDDEKS